jgi:hypothetical protein
VIKIERGGEKKRERERKRKRRRDIKRPADVLKLMSEIERERV